MQFALLGDVQFELITYFDGLEGHFAADYAEHALIEGKPRLQFIGDKLDEWSLKLRFHAGYCDPEAEVVKLRRVLAAHQALPFILANGEYKGEFVILDVTVTAEHTNTEGRLIAADADMKLKEHVLPRNALPQRKQGLAVKKSGVPVPASVAQAVKSTQQTVQKAQAALAPTKQAVSNAIKAAKQVTTAARAVQSVMAAARTLSTNPAAAVAQLVRANGDLSRLTSSSSAVNAALGPVQSVLGDAAPVLKAASVVTLEARGLQGALVGLSPANVASRISGMQGSMDRLDSEWGKAAAPLAKLAARAAVRGEPLGTGSA